MAYYKQKKTAKRRAEINAHSATIPDKRQPSLNQQIDRLQTTVGNQQVNKLLAQRTPQAGSGLHIQREAFNYINASQQGNVTVTTSSGLISVNGRFTDTDNTVKQITASLKYSIDKDNPKRIVIGNIQAQPKRTGIGSVLIYHLARKALESEVELIGTDLSALEEGTPDFYQSIGLQPDPSPEVIETIRSLESEGLLPLKQKQNILWAGKLNATTDTLFKRAMVKVLSGKWAEK